jgi:chromosome partitioning protein
MKMLGVLSRKGGVGKTTLAIHIAVLADQAGLRTLLVDLDPQRSAASWWRARTAETPPLVETDPGSLRDILEAASEDKVDLVVVDARPSLEADAAHVAALADIIMVPTRPAIFDLRAILGTLDIVKGTKGRSLDRAERLPAAARHGGGFRRGGRSPRAGGLWRARGARGDCQPQRLPGRCRGRSDGL